MPCLFISFFVYIGLAYKFIEVLFRNCTSLYPRSIFSSDISYERQYQRNEIVEWIMNGVIICDSQLVAGYVANLRIIWGLQRAYI